MREPTLQQVTLIDGFWAEKLRMNAETAIYYQWQQLENTHCIDNFRIAAGLREGFREGFFFADSDAYKWLDAASRILAVNPAARLEDLVNGFIAVLEKAQAADGYLYTYNQIHFPGMHWVNLQIEHEFYCIGHLIEAGISHFEATSETRLLNIARKAADLLVRGFADSIPDYTDGHEEIEIALIRLWKATDAIEYLALAKAFVERRGMIRHFPWKMLAQVIHSGRRMKFVNQKKKAWQKEHPGQEGFQLPARNRHKVLVWAGPRFAVSALSGKYNQQHQPVADQTLAEGHAVRFTYLKTAEAMLAQIPGEEHRIRRLHEIWDQMVTRRMYVSGGIGSLPFSEGFGRDFELDPEVAYAETCAALGCMLWDHEMAKLTGEASFEDLFEWQLYNAASVGIGLDGKSYFYNNPLASRGGVCRAAWYDIPCCPSNLSRVWQSLGRNVCLYDASEVRISQFVSARVHLIRNHPFDLVMNSHLPWVGNVDLQFKLKQAQPLNLVMRLPAWAQGCSVSLNGEVIDAKVSERLPKQYSANGLDFYSARWMKLSCTFNDCDEVQLKFEMPLRLIRQDRRIPGCGGKFALTHGPLLYCLESIDNTVNVLDASVKEESLQLIHDERTLGGIWKIQGVSEDGIPVTFIPYHLWGNRGISKMSVFFRSKDRPENSGSG